MAAKTRKAGRTGIVAETVLAKVKSVGEAVKVNAQGVADEAVARLLANDRAGGDRTYGEIVGTAAFREAAALICEAHESDGGELVEAVAQLLVTMRWIVTTGHRVTLWAGTYDEEELECRQAAAVKHLREAAKCFVFDTPGFREIQESLELALQREHVSPQVLDLSNQGNVRELAYQGQLANVLNLLAENVKGLDPFEITRWGFRANMAARPAISPKIGGTRGSARASTTRANRGALICGLDALIPPAAHNRKGLIAKLASLTGEDFDHRHVGGILQSRTRTRDRKISAPPQGKRFSSP